MFVVYSASLKSSFHAPLSAAKVTHSWLFRPASLRSLFGLSSHWNFSLPLLSVTLGSLSSPILCTYLAHFIPFPTTFLIRCLVQCPLSNPSSSSILSLYSTYSSDAVVCVMCSPAFRQSSVPNPLPTGDITNTPPSVVSPAFYPT